MLRALADERTITSICGQGDCVHPRFEWRRSHDRYLLDETVDQIAEVEDHRLTLYQGNYSAYATEKQLRLLRQQQAYAAAEGDRAHRGRHRPLRVLGQRRRQRAPHPSRQKMLDRMERIEKPVMELGA